MCEGTEAVEEEALGVFIVCENGHDLIKPDPFGAKSGWDMSASKTTIG